MIKAEIKNLGEVVDTLDKWLEDVEALATKVAKGLAATTLHNVLNFSVQYSGDFAANWNYSINSIDTTFTPGAVVGPDNISKYKFGKEPNEGSFQALISREMSGSLDEAPQFALRRNRGKDNSFKLGDTIYISNSAKHDDAYAVGIETGTIHLKESGNYAPLKRAMQAALREAGGTSSISGNAVIDATGAKNITRWTQIDSLRRRARYG